MDNLWRLSEISESSNTIADYYEAISLTFDDVYFARGKFADAPWNDLSLELAEISEAIKKVHADSIADFGCGTGHWSGLFLNQCSEINLIDASSSMLELAQSNFRALNPDRKAKFWLGDVLEESVASLLHTSVDVSILGFVLSHYSDFDVRRILTNVSECSERILIIDSTTSDSLARQPQFKEHYINDRWYSVPKRYESLQYWLNILFHCRLQPKVLAHTKHFSAIISSKN